MPIQNPDALARLFQLAQRERQPGPGQTPGNVIGNFLNDYVRQENPSFEQRRERALLQEMDAMGSQALAADRARAESEYAAQQAGFRNVAEAARQEREIAAQERQAKRESELLRAQTALGVADITARGRAQRETEQQGAAMERAKFTQGQQMQRQRNAQLEAQARALESDRGPKRGMLYGLQQMLGIKPSNVQEAQELRRQMAQPNTGGGDVQTAAAEFMRRYPGRSLDEVIRNGAISVDSDDEYLALKQALEAMGGF